MNMHVNISFKLINQKGLFQQNKSHSKAKSLNVLTIFRVFIIDSQALNRSIQLIKKVDPDYVEVLPGIAHKIVENVREATGAKIIAGGLIEEEKK